MIFPLTSAGIPTNGNGENASYVLGRTDFTGDNVGNEAYNGLDEMGKPAYDSTNNLLYMPDQGTNRVLIFNVSTTIPAASPRY